MFGNTGIQSSWANPQQNQQQPQQPQQPQSGSVFGQPNAFGSGGGGGTGGGGGESLILDTFSLPLILCYSVFGSGGGFGQNPQQQPPQANSMFGNIASNPNPTPATGSSTFG